jgi:uncharacterized protein
MDEAAVSEERAPMRSAAHVAIAAIITMALATAASYLPAKDYAATAVGLVFLGATYVLVLRHDVPTLEHYGLGFAGFFEPGRVPMGRMARASLRAFVVALLLVAVIAPFFLFGYRYWADVHRAFDVRALRSIPLELPGQLLVVAIPEEAFFRGFLQTELDRLLRASPRFLGANNWWSILLTSAIFSLGHFITLPYPARLAVFFPSLLFGLLRARTGGVGASCLFHAGCNLLSSTLAHGYAP